MTSHPDGPVGGSRPRPIIHLSHEQDVFARGRGVQDHIADAITAFAGSMAFVYVHMLWFAGWIAVNEGMFGQSVVFDPYPFGLLTMIVSLEAIFLSTFVMVSQNRQAARDAIRADLNFEASVRSAVWSTNMGRAMGLDPEEIERQAHELMAKSRTRMEKDMKHPG
ncbi:hypothetical protein GCM10020367_27930 [Streptomyces sannanensis]|uniref:DUF1003 domain-containing protein n=1 Tax=Streptomyces sannanensis TaxID=285536 RepID=A0ABP6SB65_9ACTN